MRQDNTRKKTIIFIVLLISLFVGIMFLVKAEDSIFGKPIIKQNYEISRSKIDRRLSQGTIFTDIIIIHNRRDIPLFASFLISGKVKPFIKIESKGIVIEANSYVEIPIVIMGKNIGNFEGFLEIKGDINEKIAIYINVTKERQTPKIILKVTTSKRGFRKGGRLKFKIDIKKLIESEIYNISLYYQLTKLKDNLSYFLGKDKIEVNESLHILKEFKIPENITSGEYVLSIKAKYLNSTTESTVTLRIRESLLKYKIFGKMPLWSVILGAVIITLTIITIIIIRKNIEKRKKYKGKVDIRTLPKKSDEVIWLGRIAETNINAYLELNQLMTHTIVAGATGGGKSISAQVIVEEALSKGIAVVVFDPTAQWSGMLRKCEDKKMLKYYAKFNMKEKDARAFNGNIRQITNPREYIDITRYMNPGQIQIFTLNKLTPSDIDLFVSGTISSIFKANLQESPKLRLLLVFDEVHRLLSRFGGSGEGFIQVERACREFRKWGIGIILVSQVLSDFVGEIKANITTEIQMRTRDEGDLERIKTKYGGEMLQSLVKASVGVGMLVNPSYNRGRPYFVNFRPILHNTRRLSDEELERYNKYNEEADELEWQITQLEKEGVDVFDLKMELKLVLDKIKSGNFNVVDIYLEGLKPRIKREWEKLGKKPKPREVKLIEETALRKSLEEAKKAREEWEKRERKKKKEERREEKEENLFKKIVSPLTLENGIMISSLSELKDVLEILDEEIFKLHVNEQKNDIAKWVKESVKHEEMANKLMTAKTKEDISKVLEAFEAVEREKEIDREKAKKKEK